MEEEIKNVAEEVTENVEAQTTEETEESIELTDTTETTEEPEVEEEKEEEQPKGRFMTDEEIDKLVMKKVNRRVAKIEAQKEKELANYKDTENVLKAGLDASNMEEANEKLRDFYSKRGVKLPPKYSPGLSSRENKILAEAEAEEIIEDGYETMVSEANKLAEKKYENLNEREKVVFGILAERLTQEKNKKALLKLGAKEELLQDENFNSFMQKFNSKTPIQDIYEIYQKTNSQSKPKTEKMGSMKSVSTGSKGVKDFYTVDEARAFTREDLDKNPDLVKAIENSMTKW